MQFFNLTWIAATITLALFVHISTVLAIPYLSENDAWRRLEKSTQPNKMHIFKDLKAGNKLWAFHAPDIKYAICRYDIARAPVRVDFELLRGVWSVALYDNQGRNFYAADGFDLLRERMSLFLIGPDHLKIEDQGLPLAVPSEQGLVVIRAPVDNGILEKQVIEKLERAKCVAVPQPKRVKDRAVSRR